MTKTQEIILFLSIILINTLICVIYYLRGVANHKKDEGTRKYLMLAVFMFFCPVAGPLFLALGTVGYYLFFDSSIDLAAITFSKERVEVLERPDEESEMNLVPMEEAIMIENKESLRQLLLTVLRGDMSKSINAVTKALNSSDSEASHYAASAIMDITAEFQKTIQKFQAQLTENPEDLEVNQLYIEYLIQMLNTNFLSKMELKTYVYELEHVCIAFYDHTPSGMKVEHMSGLIGLLTKIGDLQAAEPWLERIQKDYPDDMEMYRCALHFYYDTKNKIKFFELLTSLKQSDVTVDKDLLEMIRIFN